MKLQNIQDSESLGKAFWALCRQHKIKARDMRLLFEAYRRKHLLKTNSPEFWGLGTPSVYVKSIYFKPSFPPCIARVNNWFTLTDKGTKAMELLEQSIVVPKKQESQNRLNTLMFELG